MVKFIVYLCSIFFIILSFGFLGYVTIPFMKTLSDSISDTILSAILIGVHILLPLGLVEVMWDFKRKEDGKRFKKELNKGVVLIELPLYLIVVFILASVGALFI